MFTDAREGLLRVRRRIVEAADRAKLLAPAERAVVDLVLRRGSTKEELSRLTGVAPRTLARRLERVLRRMQGRRFVFVASHLGRWSPRRREVATHCVLHGRSQRRAAAELGVPVHAVRRELLAIEAMLENMA